MLFTLILWAVAIVVHFSGRHNKTNIWCARCFAVTSIGTLKEFVMDSVVPLLLVEYPGISFDFYMRINSCLTAVLYLATPYCVIMLSMYFARMNELNRKLFYGMQILTAGIAAALLFRYQPVHFKYYQENRPDFWYCMSAYNLGCGAIGTWMMLRDVRREENHIRKRQKRLSIEVLSPPYYWWLATIFIIHTLGMTGYMKVWKLNRYVSMAVLIYYLIIAYREGIMGVKFSIVRYQWNNDITSVDKSTQYINHMIKNQVAKIDWSVDLLRPKLPEGMQELDIIHRAAAQLMEFTRRTNQFLSISLADTNRVLLSDMIRRSVEDCQAFLGEGIGVDIVLNPDVCVMCDKDNMVEVFSNLIVNSCEAMKGKGHIRITGGRSLLKWSYEIRFIDNGPGIKEENRKDVFAPFYTTKNQGGGNYGLGLSFCKTIMQAHNGSIALETPPGGGTSFVLRFPMSRIKKR